eukprot:9209509-Pyramimonas_sp.AAC.1
MRFEVQGASRCPAATARAVAARAFALGDFWGPCALRKRASIIWNKLLNWSGRAAQAPEAHPPRPRMITGRKAAQALLAVRQRPHLLEGRQYGRVTHVAALAQMNSHHFTTWFQKTSQGRRWQPSVGEEWQLLPYCVTFTCAYHVLRARQGAGGMTKEYPADVPAGSRPAECG